MLASRRRVDNSPLHRRIGPEPFWVGGPEPIRAGAPEAFRAGAPEAFRGGEFSVADPRLLG